MSEHNETKLQIAVAHYLRGEIGKLKVQAPFPGLLWMHPNNEFSDEKEAFWAKAKGILPGAADLLFWWAVKDYGNVYTKTGAIELKVEKRGQSGNQRTFQEKFEATGGKYAVCRSVAEVRDTLISWNLECRNLYAIEPKPSRSELVALQMAAFAP